jgi:magnesium transporter
VIQEAENNSMTSLDEAIEARDGSALISIASDLHYADLAHHYEHMDEEHRDFFLQTIGPELATDLIGELPSPLIEEALQHFKPAQLRIILGRLSDDDRVDIFQIVSPENQRRYFSLLGPHDEKLTRSLLKYDEDTAGGRMTTAIGRITADMTVKEAITVLRRDQESAETLSRIFVVDAEGRLVGKVRLRDLAFHPWQALIYDIMENADERVLATVDQEEAARILSKYDLIVLPVIDEFDHLLGVITYDDAIEILQKESTEDIEKLAAIGGENSELSYINTSVKIHFRRRAPWLIGLAFLAIASGYAMFSFASVLSKASILSLFIPMVSAAGGNSGGQAAIMVIRAMSLGEIGAGSALRIAWKEMRTGLILGLTLGLCMAVFIIFVLPNIENIGVPTYKLAIAVTSALIIQVSSSTILGSMLPFLARSVKLDPAVVSSPSLASIVDVTGILIYFTSARLILSI